MGWGVNGSVVPFPIPKVVAFSSLSSSDSASYVSRMDNRAGIAAGGDISLELVRISI